ncbi:expressed unknown protein [Seminavis robusta]|uniref:NadR/Ttd14 AAA domain-containing protein n=1 Tax=Seminavis robusta TaxID=568900 RepID=A0A9N8H963_9STRA|nr:expressed unknown protein [Seminavis robusta]|eukprot:Sro180_g078870.1 n/a (216) ;mRNA; f:83041-83766
MPTGPIFFMGGGGTGKTTLLNMYTKQRSRELGVITEVARSVMREKQILQVDLSRDDVFWDLQIQIAQQQIEQERTLETSIVSNYISDRCVLDALAYATLRFPDSFPPLGSVPMTQSGQAALVKPLLGSSEVAAEVLKRYRGALMVLVRPFDSNDACDDGVRLVMSRKELDQYTARCRVLLDALEIPFVQVGKGKPNERLRFLEQCVERFQSAISS